MNKIWYSNYSMLIQKTLLKFRIIELRRLISNLNFQKNYISKAQYPAGPSVASGWFSYNFEAFQSRDTDTSEASESHFNIYTSLRPAKV